MGSTPVPILLYGATGRMGRAIRDAIDASPDFALSACVARSHAADERPCPDGCVWLTPDALARDGALNALPRDLVVIDVSLPAGTEGLLSVLERTPRALLAATTGLSTAVEARLETLARRGAVLRASNLSLGMALLRGFLRGIPPSARRALDADIVEHHHAAKKDAPSGTARALAALIEDVGSARRGAAMHSLRGGTVPGTHEVILSGEGEILTLGHVVLERAVFARGALRAARFLHGREAGLYAFEDVLA